MSQGRHAADDRSLGRSTTLALGRGLLLVGVAVVISVVLLHTVPTPATSPSGAGPARSPATSAAISRHRPGSGATTTTVAPSQVAVLVANGTSVGKGASHLSTALGSAGYHMLTPTDTTQAQSASAVYFVPGYADAAAAIANLLQLSPSTVQGLPSGLPVPSVAGADIVVVEGPDLAQRFSSSSSLTTATSTAATSTTATSTTAGSG